MQASPSHEQGWLGGASRLLYLLLGSCSSLLSLLSPASLCLHLGRSWSLLGYDSCGLSPGSWALEPGGPGGCPLPARPGLRPASPCPACGQERRPGAPPCVVGEGLSSWPGQCPSAAWWSWGPHPQGSPPLTRPGSCSGLGQVLGAGEGQCSWSPEAALEDAVLNCLRGCVLVSRASWR